ncbi:hypothetical protein PHYSODRAFT_255273 [Phytophthora sojae]|uniref:Major facilitator superfamily (MFS) profile domain-containing protein n=1 Tax=Phytophthora sojae (strain P6497) TaxID=1094619 RepID=G4YEA6_PHYSP|nr:hypothetical protein PHYSODRAFT_255273 [Phytophthora sojae]EGZ26813.1 hypothetical protein PHYSODRAFT_255273 [Phytophthora sojae]|eukprot:XP_009514088.1 hypothetical protein PHYSODRAFT_255273 [Phytophthora sojae]
MSTRLLESIEIRTSRVEFDSLATPETPKDGFKSHTMLPSYAVQLAQLSGPLSGVLIAPIIGVYSDRLTSRFGRRRPFLIVAAVGSIICWILTGYTRELGDALGDVGTGKPGEVTDRKWTAVLTVFFYVCTGIAFNVAQTPALLLISVFAGSRQTIGAAMGQGWATLGAIVIAVYTEFFGAAYNSLHWFLGMLSFFMAFCVGAACYVAKETPLDRRMLEKRNCSVLTLPGVLTVFCVVIFLNQYAFAAYNANKGMFFEAQLDYNRGVKLAGGLADMLSCVVGYLYTWVLPPLVLLMVMAFCDVVALDVTIVAFSSIAMSTFFSMIVPVIVHVFGHTADIGVYVGVINAVNSSGQLLNFTVGSALVKTSMGYRLPVFAGGAVSLLAFLVCACFFKTKMNSM